MGRSASDHLTDSTAREVCKRTNSAALLEGLISKNGQHYRLDTRVLDCHSGDTLTSVSSDAANRDGVIPVIGQMGDELRKGLGESLASVEKYDQPLEQATTPSIEALQAYTQGSLQQSQKGDAAAVPYYKLAVELDPNFAVAHAALGQAHYTLYEVSLALEHFRRAFALRERVSKRERFYIEGVYYFLTGDLERSIQTYEEWVKAYPRDYEPHNYLSRRLRSTGQYERALAESRQALALNNDSASVYSSLMIANIRLNRLDDAKAAFAESQARKLDGTYLHLARYQVAFLEGDDHGMAEEMRAENGKPGIEDIMLHGQATTEAYYGRFRRSRELGDRAVETSNGAGAPERAAIYKTWQALHEVEAGNSERARKTIADALALSKGEYVIAKAALALARAGNAEQAQKLADQLNQELPLETLEQNYSLPVIQAAIELNRNNPAKSIDILRVTIPYDLGASSICCFFPAYVRGLAYLKLGKAKEAAGEFQQILNHPGTTVNFITGSLAHLQLARAQVMMGDEEAARKSYQDFLTLWKDADPDIPIYRQAKAEYAKLK
jgi:tetratricopeptide (TPR) repeat protein